MSDQEEPTRTDAQKPVTRKVEERRRYGVQMLAEKCPRVVSLYFFGFGIWTAVVHVGFLIPIIGMLLSDDFPRYLMSDGIPSHLMTAGLICFRVLSILLSLLALWLTHSPAKHRAPHDPPRPGSAKSPGGTSHTAVCRAASAHRLGVPVRLRNILGGKHGISIPAGKRRHNLTLRPNLRLHTVLPYTAVRAGRHTGVLFPAQKIIPAHTTVIAIRLPAHSSCLSLPFRDHRVRTSRAYAPGVTSGGR